MTSRGPGKRVRKAPAERRNEIVTTAARVGLTEGLECVTLRRVADELGVQAGLVGHYFPAADKLVAEAFASATMTELDTLLPEAGTDAPLGTLRNFFGLISSAEFDNISQLWLNARHLSRYRPVLREHVVEQELRWCRRIERVVAAGVAAGDFRCVDPWVAAVRILVAIDGTTAYINTSADHRAAATGDMVRTFAEAELGVIEGTLDTPPVG
ncbi:MULTISPECIES: TetR/AcrR family transcriptional regulator [unclassified Streptomyces]|uniref:TetR/AcrR family transcriptional regulator n=1 Tax=unclassified Streptomyces TaxID=2593676 RepID=UPI00136A560D|nr:MULTISPECIES: TetR family transcriptional regulator C-terminal domain-containing protein [unclassified Streptomyces]MCW5251213.1 TetR family transcriptional regulator C-terminal domain-containing protein [Streptomyces sp. SHP 1-2]MYU23255.1 TetR family transcriptional regulator [Streptomyces sp. SID8352]